MLLHEPIWFWKKLKGGLLFMLLSCIRMQETYNARASDYCLGLLLVHLLMDLTTPRWKGKGFADIAFANPMSNIVRQVQNSLSQSKAYAILSGCDALLEAEPELADLLNRSCFGRVITTCNKDSQLFQLGPEEAFYLCHALKCLILSRGSGSPMNEVELWQYLKFKSKLFPELYKAYAHLRSKNWVVRSGMQYGVEFVVYRHHPALVHAEYAALVLCAGNRNVESARLKVWSDLLCTIRVCGGVAKRLLVLSIDSSGTDTASPSCLENYTVEERTIIRWVPEQCREDHGLAADEPDGSTCS